MEVVVQSLHNVDPGSIISIRAGSTRRQGPTPLEKPFRFPNLPLNVGSIKVDVMRPLGSQRVSVAPEAEMEYSVKFPAKGGGEPMLMEVLVRELPQMCGVMNNEQDNDDTDRRAAAEDSARSYIERWRLMDFIREMLQYIIREKPQDPYAFMSTYLRRRTRRERESPSYRDPPMEASISQDSLRATIARQNARLDAENERLRGEIDNLRQFCEEKGLPPVDEPLDLNIDAAALEVNQDLSGRNSQLKIEHQELRKTLDSFCRGFQELAGKLNKVMLAPRRNEQGPTAAPGGPLNAEGRKPQYEDVYDAEEFDLERQNERIARENAELSRQIETLLASSSAALASRCRSI